jgi:hypothetical protein
MKKTSHELMISQLLDGNFSDSDYEEFVSIKNDLSDAVVEQHPPRELLAIDYYRHIASNPIDHYILNSIGHIPLMPSDKIRRNIIRNAYAYYIQSQGIHNKNYHVINFNNESEHAFINELIAASKEEKELYEGSRELKRKVFLISGERGIGKTFFINHLFTKYFEYLNSQKVIFVRIDLTKNFEGRDYPDLTHWLLASMVRIIFRNYYKNPAFSEFDDIADTVIKIIRKDFVDSEWQHKVIGELIYVVKSYQRRLHACIDELSIDKLLANILIDFTIKKGYSFIYIIDNLDILQTSIIYKNNFEYIIKNLNQLLGYGTRIGGCFVILCSNSLLQYINYTGYLPTAPIHYFVHKEIGNIPFKNITQKRLDAISYYSEKIAHLDKSIINERIANFIQYLMEISESDNLDDLFYKLDNLYGPNQRAKINFLQLCYYNSLKHGKKYQLLEEMCRAGFRYPPAIYSYEYERDKLRRTYANNLFANVFVPNIFRFPFNKNFPGNKIPPSRTYMLMGIRIIQLLLKYNYSLDKGTVILLNELIDELTNLFDYKKDIMMNFIAELCEYNYIEIIGNQLLFYDDYGRNARIIIKPVINALFTQQQYDDKWLHGNIINNIAYLNMSSMRVLVNKKCLQGELPLFKALSLSDESIPMRSWVGWKIANAISMYRLIKKANELEEKYLSRIKKISINEYRPLFAFTDSMKHHLINQINSMLNQVNERDKELIYKFLLHYSEKWLTPNNK